MLWGATLRSPHPRRACAAIDIAAALAVPGVHAVLTHEDVPGREDLRPRVRPTSPCWPSTRSATRASRSRSSPPTTPTPPVAAAALIEVDYEVAGAAGRPGRARSPPARRRSTRRQRPAPRPHPPRGPGRRRPTSWCAATYEVGHAGPGLPRPGVRARGARPRTAAWTCRSRRSGCTWTASRSRAGSGSRPSKVRLTLAGVGGAFGGREDVSMQIHACMLALAHRAAGEDVLRRARSRSSATSTATPRA